MPFSKGIDLQRQTEIVERWLKTPGISSDEREAWLEGLSSIQLELKNLDAAADDDWAN